MSSKARKLIFGLFPIQNVALEWPDLINLRIITPLEENER